jgi:hypothetical protein
MCSSAIGELGASTLGRSPHGARNLLLVTPRDGDYSIILVV